MLKGVFCLLVAVAGLGCAAGGDAGDGTDTVTGELNTPPAASNGVVIMNPTSQDLEIIDGCAGINLPKTTIGSRTSQTFETSRGYGCFTIDTEWQDDVFNHHYPVNRNLSVGGVFVLGWNTQLRNGVGAWDFFRAR